MTQKDFSLTSTRNHHAIREKNGEYTMTEFKIDKKYLFQNQKPRKYQNFGHYNKIKNMKQNVVKNNENVNSQIYIPKKN